MSLLHQFYIKVTTFNLKVTKHIWANYRAILLRTVACYRNCQLQHQKTCYKIDYFRYGIAHIGRVGSVFMTLSVTLERFFAILYPLKRLRIKTPLLVASVAFSCLYNIPRFLEFETIVTESEVPNEGKANETEGNETANYEMVINLLHSSCKPNFADPLPYWFQITQFAATDLRLHPIYINVYVTWMKFFIVELIPYVIILVLNALIIVK